MRKLYCEEHEVDANHNVLVIDMIDTFECYLMEHYIKKMAFIRLTRLWTYVILQRL